MNRLPNPACRELGYCAEFCGMCYDAILNRHNRDIRVSRQVNLSSLFAACRAAGKCKCGLCSQIAADIVERGGSIEDEYETEG